MNCFHCHPSMNLPALLEAHPALEGLNITIPYKKEVLSFLTASAIPAGLDACNCIKIKNGQLTGYNTDVMGFEQSLQPLLNKDHQRALVLGNGGAAESIMFVLKKKGIPFEVVSRKLHGVSTITYNDLSPELIRSHQLIINTTPVGTFPDTGHCPDIPYEGITAQHLLYDLVYNPPLTLFLQKGKERGAQLKTGKRCWLSRQRKAGTSGTGLNQLHFLPGFLRYRNDFLHRIIITDHSRFGKGNCNRASRSGFLQFIKKVKSDLRETHRQSLKRLPGHHKTILF